jgi:ABC-2 type transport system permease protein
VEGMKTIILKEFKLNRRSLIIWLIVMIVTILYGAFEYPMISQNLESITPTLNSMPRIVQIMFGVEGVSFKEPAGYYITMYFWCAIIAYLHAMMVGIYLIGKDQRHKTSDFLYTKPYNRQTIILSKIIVGMISVLLMTITTAVVTSVSILSQLPGEPIIGLLMTTMTGMFMTQMLFFAIGCFVATVVKHYKRATTIGIMVLLYAYVVAITIQYIGELDYLNWLTPIRYFDVSLVATEGISQFYLTLTLLLTASLLYLTIHTFQRKDLMI